MFKFLKQFVFVSLAIAILMIGGLAIYSATPSGGLKINPILGHDLDLNGLYYGQAANSGVHDIATQDISISAWVKVDVDAGASNIGIFGKGSATGGHYRFHISTLGYLIMQIGDGDTYYVRSATDLRDNKWHYVTGIIDRDATLNCKVFVDGVDVSNTRNGEIGNATNLTNTGTLNAGAISGVWLFDGQLRDVKLYYAAGDHWSDAQVLYQAQHPFDYTASAGTTTDYWRLDEGSGTTLYGKVNNLTLSNVLAWTTQPKIKMVKQENTTTTSNNPVGWWKMDEGTASSSYDSSGNGNTGTLTGGVQWATGKLGKGLSFDGVNDYVDAGDPASGILDMGTSDFSIEAWFYANGLSTRQHIISKGSHDSACDVSTSAGYALIKTAAGALQLYINTGSAQGCGGVLGTAGSVTSGWHHAVAIADRDGNASIYLDGRLNNSTSISGQSNSLNTIKSFIIGSYSNGNTYYPFNGLIDDVRIYNRALSAGEVGQMYNSTKDGYLGNIKVSTGLVGYWKLDDNNALTSVIDYSGKGNTGTAYSGTATTTSVLSTSTAMIGRAMGFDGVDDYIAIADNANLRPGLNDFTVSFWIKTPYGINPTSYPGILVKGLTTSAPAHTWGFLAGYNESNTVRYRQAINAGGSWGAALTTSALSDGWHYIVVKRNGIIVQMYVDGVYYNQDTSAGDNLSSTASLAFGTAGNFYFNGLIDEVKIWNYARTAEQIQNDYIRNSKGLR